MLRESVRLGIAGKKSVVRRGIVSVARQTGVSMSSRFVQHDPLTYGDQCAVLRLTCVFGNGLLVMRCICKLVSAFCEKNTRVCDETSRAGARTARTRAFSPTHGCQQSRATLDTHARDAFAT